MSVKCVFCFILLLYMANAYEEDILQVDPSDKPVANLQESGFYDRNANQGNDWPPAMLKLNDVWGKEVADKKFHDWPSVLPWAKTASNNGYVRLLTARRRRCNASGGGGFVDIDPDSFNDRYKVAVPKQRSERRVWPYSLY